MGCLENGKDRILLVDDDKEIRNIVSLFLTHFGYVVRSAENGKEGMSVFLDSAFKLVITDLDMPEVDGLTFASYIKERAPHIPVVLITGGGFGGVGVEDPFDVVMHKPFALSNLKETVQNLLC
jgi:CheY-like chemotaxis protein